MNFFKSNKKEAKLYTEVENKEEVVNYKEIILKELDSGKYPNITYDRDYIYSYRTSYKPKDIYELAKDLNWVSNEDMNNDDGYGIREFIFDDNILDLKLTVLSSMCCEIRPHLVLNINNKILSTKYLKMNKYKLDTIKLNCDCRDSYLSIDSDVENIIMYENKVAKKKIEIIATMYDKEFIRMRYYLLLDGIQVIIDDIHFSYSEKINSETIKQKVRERIDLITPYCESIVSGDHSKKLIDLD